MSNIVKFLLMALAWLLFFLVTFYGCIKPTCCAEGAGITEEVTPAVVPPPAVEANNYAIASNGGTAAILTGALFPALRDRLLNEYRSDEHAGDMLEVKGFYYEGETAPAGFENMGLARANAIMDEMVGLGIPRERMVPLSEKLAGNVPSGDDATFYPAGNFRWEKLADSDIDPGGDRVREIDDQIIVEFAFNANTKRLSSGTEDYLKALAERIQTTNEKVAITGHTDNVDTDAFNMRLGQQRADFVKQRLISYGAPANLISTSSKGESDPVRSNDTAQGRARNRRAVINLQKQQ